MILHFLKTQNKPSFYVWLSGVQPSLYSDNIILFYSLQVPIVDRRKCSDAYIEEYGEKVITDKMLCAGYTEGGIDSCQVCVKCIGEGRGGDGNFPFIRLIL